MTALAEMEVELAEKILAAFPSYELDSGAMSKNEKIVTRLSQYHIYATMFTLRARLGEKQFEELWRWWGVLPRKTVAHIIAANFAFDNNILEKHDEARFAKAIRAVVDFYRARSLDPGELFPEFHNLGV